jgi:UrcA family protein
MPVRNQVIPTLGVLNMNIRSFLRSTVLAAAFAAAGMTSWAAGATAATPDGEVLKQVVKYGDLNLDRSEAITALYHRVGNAAGQVCAPMESREMARMSAWKKCIDGAISRAVNQINVPALTAYAAAQGHGSSPLLAARVQ